MYRTLILTISDAASRGERLDETGPAIAGMLPADLYEVTVTDILADEADQISARLCEAADSGAFDLILTNGGTGFSPRDVTPEATRAVVERPTPGIAEAMRQASLAITPRAMLSRSEAGIRAQTLIINLPGSPKAATENLAAILPGLDHGLSMLAEKKADCATPLAAATGQSDTADAHVPAEVVSVNISIEKGTVKQAVPLIMLKENWGIEGDAHAGDWHRQVSLLAVEKIQPMQEDVPFPLDPGIFAENINTRGINLTDLEPGTRLQIGSAVLRVTQIGKACHNDGCAIKQAAGHCIMPTSGIFAEVLSGGIVQAGDPITLLDT